MNYGPTRTSNGYRSSSTLRQILIARYGRNYRAVKYALEAGARCASCTDPRDAASKKQSTLPAWANSTAFSVVPSCRSRIRGIPSTPFVEATPDAERLIPITWGCRDPVN